MEAKAIAPIIKAIIAENGPAIVNDHVRMERALRSRLRANENELAALVAASKANVPLSLLRLTTGRIDASVVGSHVRRLESTYGLPHQLARTAVVAWALALGVLPGPGNQSSEASGIASDRSQYSHLIETPTNSNGKQKRYRTLIGIASVAFVFFVVGAVVVNYLIGGGHRSDAAALLRAKQLFWQDQQQTACRATSALKLFLALAQRGDPEAQDYLAWIYDKGIYGRKDATLAAEWYRKATEQWREAADKGDPDAEVAMGVIYDLGLGVTADKASSAQWFELASAQFNAGRSPKRADSFAWLGFAYSGQIANNPPVATQWFQRDLAIWSAEAARGNVDAEYRLGQAYTLSQSPLKNDTSAANWFRRAADGGSPAAQLALGATYVSGSGVSKNSTAAIHWLTTASDAGNSCAMLYLGLISTFESSVLNKNEGIRWAQKAADGGQPFAAVMLSDMYEKGTGGVPRNMAEAFKWQQKYADLGYPDGEETVGDSYESGKGVKQDYAEAVKWYRKAGDDGNMLAQVRLGELYESGKGVPKDFAQAAIWYDKAAKEGNEEAAESLGFFYETGEGFPKDEQRALYWYRQASLDVPLHIRSSLGAAVGLTPQTKESEITITQFSSMNEDSQNALILNLASGAFQKLPDINSSNHPEPYETYRRMSSLLQALFTVDSASGDTTAPGYSWFRNAIAEYEKADANATVFQVWCKSIAAYSDRASRTFSDLIRKSDSDQLSRFRYALTMDDVNRRAKILLHKLDEDLARVQKKRDRMWENAIILRDGRHVLTNDDGTEFYVWQDKMSQAPDILLTGKDKEEAAEIYRCKQSGQTTCN